jgi:hypothetical protein
MFSFISELKAPCLQSLALIYKIGFKAIAERLFGGWWRTLYSSPGVKSFSETRKLLLAACGAWSSTVKH